ncbi:MAG: PemK family transcriptional regulator [Chloroflexi bacterium RBG_16_58_14]|nr:MAG: PemK family transcriptional regulator [Chloroflexi bacterium RBG_16_58_14]
MHKGEIWLINLDPTLGAEIRKTRPGVIVNEDEIGILPLRVIVPLTDWKDRYSIAPWLVRVDPDADNGLEKPSAADAFQIRSVSTDRLARRIGRLSPLVLGEILEAIGVVIGMESHRPG